MTVLIAVVALLVAVAALVLSWLVAKQSAAVSSTLARHRHGHGLRDGQPDPAVARSRRQLNLGPPRTGERREVPQNGPDPLPGPDTPAGEPEADSGSEGADTGAMPRVRLPRPGEIGR